MITQITSMTGIEKELLPHIDEVKGTAKSMFIESLILGIPLTIIVNNDEVIQGADIIVSYLAFEKDELVLEGDIMPQLKGKKKSELEPYMVRNVKTKSIMFTNVKIDKSLAKNIFNL